MKTAFFIQRLTQLDDATTYLAQISRPEIAITVTPAYVGWIVTADDVNQSPYIQLALEHVGAEHSGYPNFTQAKLAHTAAWITDRDLPISKYVQTI